jgi:hypothetical protein
MFQVALRALLADARVVVTIDEREHGVTLHIDALRVTRDVETGRKRITRCELPKHEPSE